MWMPKKILYRHCHCGAIQPCLRIRKQTLSSSPNHHPIPYTSYPLIAMSRCCMKHRLTPLTFLLCICCKLRLPIYPNRTPCTCGHHEHDIYGDHVFCCKRGSKKQAHNIITMDFAGALSPVLAQAGYLYPNTPMAVAPLLHLRSDSIA